MRQPWLAALLVVLLPVLLSVPRLLAQSASIEPAFRRTNKFGIFGEYSNDSSHMLLGSAENRKLLNFGISYSRSLLHSHAVDFQYLVEFRPVILESDPLAHSVSNSTFKAPGQPAVRYGSTQTFAPDIRCQPESLHIAGTEPDGSTYTESYTQTCHGRQWTFGEGMSPVGVQINFLPRHRLQPVFSGLGGYMFSTQPIPTATAGSFNFTFEFGVGVELYRSQARSNSLFGNRSIRAEYRYHHISNHDTADDNPGIDNGMLQLTYAFGR